MATDPWAGFEEVTPTASASAFPGVIPGRPKAPDPVALAGLELRQDANARDARTTDLTNQLTEFKIDEAREEAREREKEAQQALKADEVAEYKLVKAISELSKVGTDANDNGGWFETGTSGSFARSVLPTGTAGYDLAGDLKTLDANFAFDALSAMREASKTGGALGAITERELDLLKSSVANLDPNLSHETFLSNVEKARQSYLAQLAKIDPALATRLGYDGAKAEAALLELDEQYAKQFNLPRSTVDRSANPGARDSTPDDIAAIMAKYGAQ